VTARPPTQPVELRPARRSRLQRTNVLDLASRSRIRWRGRSPRCSTTATTLRACRPWRPARPGVRRSQRGDGLRRCPALDPAPTRADRPVNRVAAPARGHGSRFAGPPWVEVQRVAALTLASKGSQSSNIRSRYRGPEQRSLAVRPYARPRLERRPSHAFPRSAALGRSEPRAGASRPTPRPTRTTPPWSCRTSKSPSPSRVPGPTASPTRPLRRAVLGLATGPESHPPP
jgi:hypothetical protein